MEDGNKAHEIQNKKIKDWKKETKIAFLDNWPSSSLDFNVIKSIWRLLKQHLKSKGVVLDVEALKTALQEEWEKLT